MTTTELVHRPASTVPAGEWNLMMQQADFLARANIIPNAYRRQPANVVVAAITGRQYGWDVLTAMRNGHVIEGVWAMKPEAQVGLVRRFGHSVTGELGTDRATVTGKRADTGDTMTVTFTFADAVIAGLCTLKDGKPYARSERNKPLPWENYPVMMCYWRAAGLLCRMLFSDITGGIYSAEEMGVPINEDGDVIDAGVIDHDPEPLEPMPLSDDAIVRFNEACEQVGLTPAMVLDGAFPDGVPDVLTDAHLPQMRDAYRALADRQSQQDQPQPESEEPDGQNVVVSEQRPATRGQVGKIKAEYARLGIDDRDAQLRSTTNLVGHSLATHNELAYDEALVVLEALRHSDPATVAELADADAEQLAMAVDVELPEAN